MITWNIYQVTTEKSLIKGVMFRGRVRKFALGKEIDVLVENATDVENCVRFAIPASELTNTNAVSGFIHSIIPDASIDLVLESVGNPVLSKLKVNKEERYVI